MPVVKGMASSPAASSVARRRAGVLSGEPVGGQVGVERLDHHPLGTATGPELGQLVETERPGVGVGEQPDLVHHQAGHGGQVVDGGGVAGSSSQARATG